MLTAKMKIWNSVKFFKKYNFHKNFQIFSKMYKIVL